MNRKHLIPAEAHSDDHKVKVSFDAIRWFTQASVDKLEELIKINFGGEMAADEVARYYKNTDVKKLFDYLNTSPTMGNDTVGFECHIDEEKAMAWLRAMRPEILRATYKFRLTGGLNIPTDAEEILANDGSIIGFTLEDGTIVKLIIGFEVQHTKGSRMKTVTSESTLEDYGIVEIEYDEANFEKIDKNTEEN